MARRQPTQNITGRTTNANIVFGIIASEPNVGEIIDGSSSKDRLFGSNNDDTLNGGLGNDTLYGEFGNDLLKGGNNDDRLFGGEGEEIDSLTGGLGSDIFVIGDATGVDYQSGANEDTEDLAFAIISDFSATDDFIQASGSANNYDLVSDDLLGDGIQDTGIYLGDDLIAIAENVTIDNYDRFVFLSDSDLSFANDLVKALQASIATS